MEERVEEKGLMKLLYIPHDVQAYIMSKLPVKALIKFRSVCKSWHALIATPSFLAMHHKNYQPKNNLFLLTSGNVKREIAISDTASRVEDWRFQPPAGAVSHNLIVAGSHNGIVCIFSSNFGMNIAKEYLCLWNPALRITKTIHLTRRRSTTQTSTIGFSFHGGNNYKVARITTSNDIYRDVQEFVDIYSLDKDSWRTVKAAPPSTLRICGYSAAEAYVNGAHHWPAETKGPLYHTERKFSGIISFDMSDEIFREIPRPSSCMQECASLFNYNDSLAIFTMPYCHCEFWVMKEYRVPESWTKQCHINRISISCKGLIRDKYLVLMYSKYSQSYSGIFDIERGEEIMPDASNIRIPMDAFTVTTFKESLYMFT